VSNERSDSQSLDNMLEVLLMGGLDPLHAMRLLCRRLARPRCARPGSARLLRYYSVHMEPGRPGGVVLTDAAMRGARWIANGLRPARFCITSNRVLTIASETGVWDNQPEDRGAQGQLVRRHDRARPQDRHAARLGGHRSDPQDPPSLQELAPQGCAI